METLAAAINNALCRIVTGLNLPGGMHALCYDRNMRYASSFIIIALIGIMASVITLKSRRR